MQQENIQEENRQLNPKMFSAPKSLKEQTINVINKLQKQITNLKRQINERAAANEDYNELQTQLSQTETQLTGKFVDFKNGMKEFLTKLKSYENKNFARFNDCYHGQNPKILQIIQDLAKELGLHYKTLGLVDHTIVIYKQEDLQYNFTMYLQGERNAGHPRNNKDSEPKQQELPNQEPIPEIQLPTKLCQPLPPDVIREIVLEAVSDKQHTIGIKFDQPEDYGYPVEKFRICQLDMKDETLSLQPAKRIVLEFGNDKQNVQIKQLTFKKVYGKGELPFDEMIFLSIEAKNKNGWSSELELCPIKLYLKYLEPQTLFMQGAVNPHIIEQFDIIEVPQQITIDEQVYYLLEDFNPITLDQDSIRQASVKHNSVGLVNNCFTACQWGEVLNFKDERITDNYEVTDDDFALSNPFMIFTKQPISKIACGAYHALGLTIDGSIFSWGYNKYGQLGNGILLDNLGMTISFIHPQPVTFLKNNSIFVVDIQAGSGISMCRTDQGDVYSWGKMQNIFGNSMAKVVNSFKDTVNLQCLDQENSQLIPRKVNIKAKQIAMGYQCFGALTPENHIYMWGSNTNEVFGFEECPNLNDQRIFHLVDPMRIFIGDYQIVDFQIGAYHCIVKDVNDQFISWGNNSFGQCGQTSKMDKKYCSYGVIEKLPRTTYKSFSCGLDHSVFLTSKGLVYQLGSDTMIKRDVSIYANVSSVILHWVLCEQYQMYRFLQKFNFTSLSRAQSDFYHQNGYLVLPNLISHQEIDKLLQRTDQLVQEADLVKNQMFFDTKNNPRGMNFLETAYKIGYLLEVGMIDENGKLKVQNKKLALNKIGHAMHDIDPVFERFSYNRIFKSVLQGVGYIDPILAQTMVIFKNQKFGTAVDMHTDNTYIISEPKLSCIGIWIALEDANKHNGCMYAFPKSHLTPTTFFNVLDETRQATKNIGPNPEYSKRFDPQKAECLEVSKGSVILLHGDLVHFSGHNHSAESRHAYTLHLIEGHNNNWSKDAWLQRTPELPFRRYYERVDQL